MAGNDTAALVVALSAQVNKFEKDMQGAVKIADKHVKAIETRFGEMNGVITNKLSQMAVGASGQFGFITSFLTSLGPAGIAAAVGIGATVGGIIALANATAEFAAKSEKLKEGSETIGLTITQYKLLGESGKTVGMDFDATANFFARFIANLGALRTGSGPLYDALLKIDVGLLRQLSTTKDSAKAIDLLVAAFARLDDQTKRLDLAKAAGGRAGLTGANLLQSLAGQGGLTGLQANSPEIDDAHFKRAAQLRTEIEAISAKTKDIWGGMFSDKFLTSSKEMAADFLKIAEYIERIVGAKEKSKALDDRPATFDERFSFNARPQITINRLPQSTAGSPSVELGILQKNLSLLGEAVTQGEQWKRKRLEIAAAAESGGLKDGIAQRALAAFNVTMMAAALATRERIGVATEQQIVETKLVQLQQDKAKFGLKENEVAMATVVILREAKQAADALTVRQAYLPGLKQLELDAASLRKGLDEISVNSLNNLTTALADITTGTKSAKDAFANLGTQVIRSIEEMIIKMTIMAPIARALQSIIGGGFGGMPTSLSSGNYGGTGGNLGGLHAAGGLISGPGSGTSDSVPSMLSNGEYVVRASQVRNHLALLEAINAGSIRRFGSGGLVTPNSVSGNGGVFVNVSVHNAPAGTEVESTKVSRGSDGMNIDVILRKIDDRMVAAFKDRGHPVTRAAANTLGSNLANGIA